MRKIVKILEKIRWRKNAIADEHERIEFEFGSDHGPERQHHEQHLVKLIDEADRLNNLFISYAKIDALRKENKRINALARKNIRSKDYRQNRVKDSRLMVTRFIIQDLDQLN